MKDDTRKWFLVAMVIFGVVMTWVVGEMFTFAGSYFNFIFKPIFGVFPFYYSISAVLNFLLVFYLIKRQNVALFANETVLEVKKVSWPTSSDTAKSTGVVIVACMICALILWFYDSILTWALKVLLG